MAEESAAEKNLTILKLIFQKIDAPSKKESAYGFLAE